MKNNDPNNLMAALPEDLQILLKRCTDIEERPAMEIIESLLRPYLSRYTYNTLEEWELVRDTREMEEIIHSVEINDNFDPNSIPFDTQILGIRRKLDEIRRQIDSSDTPRPDLEELHFSLKSELNFAEQDALSKQQLQQEKKKALWIRVCKENPLKKS